MTLYTLLCLCVYSCCINLSFYSEVFQKRDVLMLADSLKELSETSGSSLTELSVGYLAGASLVGGLLDACHNLRSFSMEVHPMEMFHRPLQEQPPRQEARAGDPPLPPHTHTCERHVASTTVLRNDWLDLMFPPGSQ